jgi:hypothetical protein
MIVTEMRTELTIPFSELVDALQASQVVANPLARTAIYYNFETRHYRIVTGVTLTDAWPSCEENEHIYELPPVTAEMPKSGLVKLVRGVVKRQYPQYELPYRITIEWDGAYGFLDRASAFLVEFKALCEKHEVYLYASSTDVLYVHDMRDQKSNSLWVDGDGNEHYTLS